MYHPTHQQQAPVAAGKAAEAEADLKLHKAVRRPEGVSRALWKPGRPIHSRGPHVILVYIASVTIIFLLFQLCLSSDCLLLGQSINA